MMIHLEHWASAGRLAAMSNQELGSLGSALFSEVGHLVEKRDRLRKWQAQAAKANPRDTLSANAYTAELVSLAEQLESHERAIGRIESEQRARGILHPAGRPPATTPAPAPFND